jgi:phosphoglycolate phosphatase-like HAD superfamily hydrolase
MSLSPFFFFGVGGGGAPNPHPAGTAQTTPRAASATAGPLPSWNSGTTKAALMSFVQAVTTTGSPDFVPPPERIATFDNDGTLWAEQPLYFQLFFAMDRIRALAPQHPDWKTKEPFKSVIAGDTRAALAGGEQAIVALVAASHFGMTVEAFDVSVREWLNTARHPTTGRPYTQMVYQPMLEVLQYLRANGFKTYIVSGGGAEFLRAWAETVYGIPPEQVVGSRGKLKYEARDGTPALFKLPEIEHIDDGPGKPVGIAQVIGRRPIAAFGNSDGDFEMLEYVTSGPGRRFGLIVHHTDADREWAYDRGSHIGKLERGLDEASKRGWALANMKTDWKVIYPGGGQ